MARGLLISSVPSLRCLTKKADLSCSQGRFLQNVTWEYHKRQKVRSFAVPSP